MDTYKEKVFICNNVDTVTETESGKVKGYRFDGVYTFLGIKYAEATRYMSARPVSKWSGIKDALTYGPIHPVEHQPGPQISIINPKRFWPENEDCFYLNIWTNSLDKSAKKPVVIFVHGGGYAWGSSVELECYDGSNLTKFGDVVTLSFNHRLNVLGFLDLSEYGDRYKNTANLGIQDIVFLLKWVHSNIENFGGDPHNITLIGQSGGGGKICALMQTPEAAVLFQRTVIMSGASNKSVDAKYSRQMAREIMTELGLSPDEVELLKTIPIEKLMSVTNMANEKIAGRRKEFSINPGTKFGWGPIPNDWYYGDAKIAGTIAEARSIPVMIGSVFSEFSLRGVMPNKRHATKEEKIAHVKRDFGAHTEEIIKLFTTAYPDKDMSDVSALDNYFRPYVIEYADTRIRDLCAPTYVYMNATEYPLDDGVHLWHCGDIDYFFHNTCKSTLHQIPGVTSKLENMIFSSFMNFIRTGDPNGEGLPYWPAYEKDAEFTMIFDVKCEPKVNYDRELVARLVEWRGPNPTIDY